ncbi:MAG: hypothetical protein WAN11_03165 [Syntrophobacteraceae bacterium]
MPNEVFPLSGQVGENSLRLARQPKNIGAIENPSGKSSAIGQCGDSVEVSLKVISGVISDIKVARRDLSSKNL